MRSPLLQPFRFCRQPPGLHSRLLRHHSSATSSRSAPYLVCSTGPNTARNNNHSQSSSAPAALVCAIPSCHNPAFIDTRPSHVALCCSNRHQILYAALSNTPLCGLTECSLPVLIDSDTSTVLLLGSRGARQGPRRSSFFTGQAHRPRRHQRVRPPRMRPYARRLQHLLRPHARLRPHAGLPWPSFAVPSSVASAIPTPFCSEPRGRTLRLLPASPSPRPFLLGRLAHVPRCLEQAVTRPPRQWPPLAYAASRRPSAPYARPAAHVSHNRSTP